MLKCNGKISIRQVFILLLVVILSPSIRIFPNSCSEAAKLAAWVAPIISFVFYSVLYQVISAFFKKKGINNLSDVFNAALGSIIGKILLVVYLLWSIFLFSLYIRYYAGRLLSSIFPNADMRFFLIAILIVVCIAARGKLETYMRFCEMVFLLFVVLMSMMYILLIPEVKLSNIYPVTYYDFLPALKASLRVSAIWGYLLLPFFFSDNFLNMNQIKKYGKQSGFFVVPMTVALIATVVGTLGYSVAKRMPLPFFSAVKLISVVESFDRFESVILTIWTAADVILITFFALVIINIIKHLFSLSETKYLATPVVSLGYIGSQYLASNRFELEVISIHFAIYVNLALLYVVPILILIIGKLRKKI